MRTLEYVMQSGLLNVASFDGTFEFRGTANPDNAEWYLSLGAEQTLAIL